MVGAVFNCDLRGADIFNAVLQDSNTHRNIPLSGVAAAAIDFFAPGPIRVIGGVIIAFRMGHHAENSPGRVTDTGNIIDRTVGVERKAPIGGCTVAQSILNGYLIVSPQFSQRRIIGKEFAFTVTDRKLGQFNSLGEYTGGCRIHSERNPLISEVSAIIKRECYRALVIVWCQTGQEAQIDQGLKSIADSQDQIAFVDKLDQLLTDPGLHPNRLYNAGAMVVAPAESADKHEDLVIIQFG